MIKKHKVERQLSQLKQLARQGEADCLRSKQKIPIFFECLTRRLLEIESSISIILETAPEAEK